MNHLFSHLFKFRIKCYRCNNLNESDLNFHPRCQGHTFTVGDRCFTTSRNKKITYSNLQCKTILIVKVLGNLAQTNQWKLRNTFMNMGKGIVGPIDKIVARYFSFWDATVKASTNQEKQKNMAEMSTWFSSHRKLVFVLTGFLPDGFSYISAILGSS